jgi:anti-anti-sigma factor
MEIAVHRLGPGKVEIRPRGQLVERTAARLRSDLLDVTPGAAAVLLDLSDLQAIDAAGMALVLLARIEHEAMGGRLVVQSSDPAITETLRDAGLDRFVTVTCRRLDALRALDAKEHPVPDDDALPSATGRRFGQQRKATAASAVRRWIAPVPG